MHFCSMMVYKYPQIIFSFDFLLIQENQGKQYYPYFMGEKTKTDKLKDIMNTFQLVNAGYGTRPRSFDS